MTRIPRLLLVAATCFMLFLSTAPAAFAATQTNPYQSYWSNYYGSKYGSTITQKPAATAPTTTPTTTNPPITSTPTPAPVTPPAAPATPPAPTTTSVSDSSGLSANEKLMFDLVNQERIRAGLSAYKVDMRLVNLARTKSQDMYQNNYFSHTSPTYGSVYDMERKAGISARVMGAENIAKAATTQRAHELFMGSPGHKANIMNSAHTSIGIGIVSTPYGVVVTQLFIGN